MSKFKLILADDHAVVRSGLRMLLEVQPDIDIVAEAESGTEAVEKTRALRPDIVLMDIQMPGLNRIEATKQIKNLTPETAVLALTMYEDDQ
ncbi:MAG TPA: response regulator transcription factor, partial [candidate division Zixibacteria bacterium]|nr:response regulator transcription factor [candidate division Zixibacteria bacterium]